MPLLGLDEAQAVESNDESIDREEGKPWGLEVFEAPGDVVGGADGGRGTNVVPR
jgi:hypothetical protein